ncbi:MAG: type II toxin-antitoxin system RelE/ParE family toxin [Thermoleophilia bacterium]|nr:type II toxin-antitoxin system RelE/ParE family toxin [Thermoleophilia bacterium]
MGKLSAQIQVAILDKLEELAENPRPAACEKVKELAQYGVFRVKVGKDYRVLYQVKDEAAWILVVKVADRKEIYQRLTDLKRLLK